MIIPDFGMHIITSGEGDNATQLSCKYVAPGITMSDLYKIFTNAEADWKENDSLSANPSKWKNSRGIAALTKAILEAIYSPL